MIFCFEPKHSHFEVCGTGEFFASNKIKALLIFYTTQIKIIKIHNFQMIFNKTYHCWQGTPHPFGTENGKAAQQQVDFEAIFPEGFTHWPCLNIA